MKHLLKRMAAGAMALVVSSGVAVALPALQINGGTVGDIPGGSVTNDALGPLGFVTPLFGFYGSQISLTGAAAQLQFTLLGAEAGYRNRFTWDPSGTPTSLTFSGNSFNPAGVLAEEGISSFVVNAALGTLGFEFRSVGVPAPSSVANGTNPDGSVAPGKDLPNFFASFGDGVTTSGDTLYLFFDDKPGVVTDDNHDDLVIKVQVVPLPAAAWLLLGVSGALVAAKRRSNRRAA